MARNRRGREGVSVRRALCRSIRTLSGEHDVHIIAPDHCKTWGSIVPYAQCVYDLRDRSVDDAGNDEPCKQECSLFDLHGRQRR